VDESNGNKSWSVTWVHGIDNDVMVGLERTEWKKSECNIGQLFKHIVCKFNIEGIHFDKHSENCCTWQKNVSNVNERKWINFPNCSIPSNVGLGFNANNASKNEDHCEKVHYYRFISSEYMFRH
jgi:hypothetical protein